MRRRRLVAFLVAVAVNATCATVFWVIRGIVGSPSFYSFWNLPPSEQVVLTLLYVIFGARVLIWYTRKVDAYAQTRRRGPVRILPVTFGLALFSVVISWLAVTMIGKALFRLWRLLFTAGRIDLTVVFAPLLSFGHFLFSRSTVIWLLAAGFIWPLAARLPVTRTRLLGWYVTDDPDGEPAAVSLSFVRFWNVIGYLILILSLLYQSG